MAVFWVVQVYTALQRRRQASSVTGLHAAMTKPLHVLENVLTHPLLFYTLLKDIQITVPVFTV
jgi:hypothetical protein